MRSTDGMSIRKVIEGGLDVIFDPPRKIGPDEKEILKHLTTGDMLIGFLCSARSTRAMYRTAFERARARYAVKKAIATLERDGFIKQARREEVIMLTAMGRKVVRRHVEILHAKNESSRTWDRMWRIVSFDIPKEHRPTRNALRRLLTRAGFMQAQKSVYIYPHACNELVALLREDRRLARYTFFCTANAVSAEEKWKKIFGLK